MRCLPAELRLFALILALAAPCAAGAVDPDEPTAVRVSKRPGSAVHLEWQPPALAPDSYNVRRCHLPSLREPYYGNCVAEGLMTAMHDDAPVAGSVFYVVSGNFAGSEGSLGYADDLVAPTPRAAPPCSSPRVGGPLTLRVHLLESSGLACAGTVVVGYPTGAIVPTGGACVGLWSGHIAAVNTGTPGIVRVGCLGFTGPTGPGDIVEMTFVIGTCPVFLESLALASCQVLIADTDCGDFTAREALCELR